LPDTVERRSRLVTLVYQVLGTLELPEGDASEVEMLVALATAFHRKAQSAMEAKLDTPQGRPALAENGYASVFEARIRWSNPTR
jgi:hypothetical protein